MQIITLVIKYAATLTNTHTHLYECKYILSKNTYTGTIFCISCFAILTTILGTAALLLSVFLLTCSKARISSFMSDGLYVNLQVMPPTT